MAKPSRFPVNRNARRQPFIIHADVSDLDALVDGLDADVEAALRPAIQAGAEVLYRAVLRNVDAIGVKTGTLRGSIYQAFAKHASGPGKPVYEISWRTSDAARDANGQPIRSSLPVAPHGHLLEHGWIQRYAVHMGKDGKWHTIVRPNKRSTPKPKRNASQAEKDAYFVLRPGGPVQHPGHKFVAGAAAHFPAAIEAARQELWRRLGYAGA